MYKFLILHLLICYDEKLTYLKIIDNNSWNIIDYILIENYRG